jgi:hypothetical protein
MCGATPHAEIAGLPHVSFVYIQDYVLHMTACGATPHAEIVGLLHVSVVHMQDFLSQIAVCGSTPHAEIVRLPQVSLDASKSDGKLLPNGETKWHPELWQRAAAEGSGNLSRCKRWVCAIRAIV